MAQTKLETKPISSTLVSGEDVYKTYCASCHGLDGKGAGPVAKTMKAHPSDLTVLAKANGGK